MRRPAALARRSTRVLLVLAALVAAALTTVALRSGDARSQAPTPAPLRSGVANPCLGEGAAQLRCPDLVMTRPFGLRRERSPRGRVWLRAGNSIDSVGAAAAELRGRHRRGIWMDAVQRIPRRGGGHVTVRSGARLRFAYGHLQRRWWKFHDAARFELWRLDAAGQPVKLERVGPKVDYCLRDLRRTRPSLARSPRREVYPACSTSRRRTRVRLGTSPGWSDIYPPTYLTQWIDVTGLRGCFAYRHIADPGNAIAESNEDNNAAQVIVRLPFSPAARRRGCPGEDLGARSPRLRSRSYAPDDPLTRPGDAATPAAGGDAGDLAAAPDATTR
ncbi:lysyl oxidase family protein [Patulibacter brassicae]|uniref:Lysyl oxidase family protein n=1 Tax=Patulibacter brassicae TaxID=1705717 RepID=A0ABU4VK00_9ACTN|nr:lysyl oxidase family protein [Patulibacter brassicae]MDX8152166.1 lysyl oxidase family protein [Patulibacter brassicae]